jgi:hypothetical protein
MHRRPRVIHFMDIANKNMLFMKFDIVTRSQTFAQVSPPLPNHGKEVGQSFRGNI